LGIPAAYWATNDSIVGTNTDLPTTVICLVAAWMTFRGLDEDTGGRGGGANPGISLAVAMILFALAITFKLSSLVLAALGWIVALLGWCRLKTGGAEKPRLILGSVGLSVALFLPWTLRGVLLTGYPLYPSTVLAAPVDWRVPVEVVEKQAAYTRWFGRNPA